MPSRIVTSTYRYKRPPRKRKAVPLEGPAIVHGKPRTASQQIRTPAITVTDDQPTMTASRQRLRRSRAVRSSAIVTVKRRRSRFGDAPDMTLEEHQRRGEAADALFREIVRRAAGKPVA